MCVILVLQNSSTKPEMARRSPPPTESNHIACSIPPIKRMVAGVSAESRCVGSPRVKTKLSWRNERLRIVPRNGCDPGMVERPERRSHAGALHKKASMPSDIWQGVGDDVTSRLSRRKLHTSVVRFMCSPPLTVQYVLPYCPCSYGSRLTALV